jgi:hypothetical protein
MNKEQIIENYLKSLKKIDEKITIHEKKIEEIISVKQLNERKKEIEEIKKQLNKLQKLQSEIITNHFGAN